MDDFLKKDKVGQEPSLVDKRVYMRYIKDEKRWRTFVFNLEHHIKDKKVLEDAVTNLKKSLGTSCTYKDSTLGFGYGFGGEHSGRIKSYMIEKKLVTEDAFE